MERRDEFNLPMSDVDLIRKLTNKVKQLRHRLIQAQERNYDLRYSGLPENTTDQMKARIEWLTSEVERLQKEKRCGNVSNV